MRLPEFITAHLEEILIEWEQFARTITQAAGMEKPALRDHAEDILKATVRDMQSRQTLEEQNAKSWGLRATSAVSDRLDNASADHAADRAISGFGLMEMIAEYRALRASVIRLWSQQNPTSDVEGRDDLTRFNESIDQSLNKAVQRFTEQVDRTRQMFLAILGHDLRNPLNAIAIAAVSLEEHCQNDPNAAAAVSQVITSAEVIQRIIGDLLDYTLSHLGPGMPIVPVSTNLKPLLEQLLKEYRTTHANRTIHCHCEGDLDGQWDEIRLRQAISNLIGNALQHSDQKHPITVTAKPDGQNILLTVHNGGPPLSPQSIPSLFEPFVRGPGEEPFERTRSGSVGLGLYIVKQVIQAHGGRIDVESSQTDGTTFIVRLPRHATPN